MKIGKITLDDEINRGYHLSLYEKTFVSDFVLLGGKGYLCICQLIKL